MPLDLDKFIKYHMRNHASYGNKNVSSPPIATKSQFSSSTIRRMSESCAPCLRKYSPPVAVWLALIRPVSLLESEFYSTFWVLFIPQLLLFPVPTTLSHCHLYSFISLPPRLFPNLSLFYLTITGQETSWNCY